MKQTLPENLLARLSGFIASNLALHFPEEKWVELEHKIKAAAKESGYSNVEKFIQYILSSPLTREQVEVLAANLTIGETYFWREPGAFDALEQTVFPGLIRAHRKGNKKLRIWCAGCSTGEEPYSIAILLDRLIPKAKDWDISILATDINPRVLLKATTGEYGKWSFRGTPHWLKEKYFLQKPDNRLEIIPEIKRKVKFEYLNLAEDIYPSSHNNTKATDIIFCRNVLMYFTPDCFRQVVQGFFNSLVNGGFLVVSASELSQQNFPEFVPVNLPGMVFYQKVSGEMINQIGIAEEETPFETGPFRIIPEPDYESEIAIPYSRKYENEIRKPEPDYESESAIPYSRKYENEIHKKDFISEHISSVYSELLNSYYQGHYAEVIEKLQKEDQTSEEQVLLIRAFANLGNLAEATKSCEKAIEANKLDPFLYYLQATIHRENNRPDEAVKSLKRAIYLDSDFVLAYYSLGNIYQQLGNSKNATKYYGIVLTILNKCKHEDILPETDGLTAGRFREMINASLKLNA